MLEIVRDIKMYRDDTDLPYLFVLLWPRDSL